MMKTTTLLTTFLALASTSSSQADAKALLRGEQQHRSLENYGNNHNDNHNDIVGNDQDDYGCITSAGYSWCASLNECLRPFETTCPPSHDVVVVHPPVQHQPVHPVHTPAHGCPAGEAFCAYTRQCQYPGACYAGGPVLIPGGDVDQYGCRASAGLSWCAASQTCEMYGYCLYPVVNNPVGGDRDQYGCIGSAGYSWCDSLKECIRTFDTVCPPLTPPVNPTIPGGDVDQNGCRASAGYSYCPSSQTCERYYDCREHQPDGDLDEYGCCPSAGYSWCASRNQCIRSWETECFVPGLPGGDVDIWGCRPSTGYSYCAYTRQCERPGDCQDGILCPAVYDPVTCDGYDFSNLCEAEREGYYPQQCTSTNPYNPQACGYIYEPVICDGFYQFSNLCLAGVAGYAEYQCVRDGGDIFCSQEYEPICCDGYDYSNQCFADISDYQYTAYQCTAGVCGGGVFCPEVYEPVCCDGYDYSNQCFADISDYQYTSYQCTAGVCRGDQPVTGCTRELDPVICAIGYRASEEFTNPCLAEEAGYDVDTDCYREGVGPGDCPPIYDPVCCLGQANYNRGFCEAERAGYTPQDCVSGLCGGISIPPCPPGGIPHCCAGMYDYSSLCAAEPIFYAPDCTPGVCGGGSHTPGHHSGGSITGTGGGGAMNGGGGGLCR